MFFSIVIPTYNSAQLLDKCLESIDKIVDENYECIVVDDGSTDKTKDVVTKYNVRYIKQPNQGPATARNKGIMESKGEVIFFTDSDCIIPADVITKYRKHFIHPDVAGVGGTYKTLNEGKSVARFVGLEISYRHKLQGQDVKVVGSFNSAFRKEVLDEVGGFDEKFPTASGEDFDLCYRIIKLGHTLKFDDEIFVYHEHPSSIHKYLIQQYRRGKSRIQNVFRHKSLAISDGYVEKGVQVQPILWAFIFFGIVLSIASPIFFILPLLSLVFLILLNRNLLSFIKSNNFKLGPLSVCLVVLRPLSWLLGSVVALMSRAIQKPNKANPQNRKIASKELRGKKNLF